jgi:hypothetical protein
MFFHAHDLKSLAEAWETALASQNDEDEVDAELDFLQSSPKEKDALEALVHHDFALKNTGEWEDFKVRSGDDVFDGLIEARTHLGRQLVLAALHEAGIKMEDSGLSFGASEDAEAMTILDELEMVHDMNAFECENACDELFAENPWPTRCKATHRVSKKSEAGIETMITKVGDSYATGTSVYGKVYLPNQILKQCGYRNVCADPTIGDVIYVRARYQGFEDCRGKLMPWRAQYVM